MALSEPIIKIVFEYGQFSASDTSITAKALFFYSFGMVGYAICEILNKSFYAIRDGKTPMFTSIIGIIVNFGTAYIFVNVITMGIGGLALASASSSSVMAIILLYMINKRKAGTIPIRFIVNLIKIIASAILCGIAAHIIYKLLNFMDGGNIITLIRAGVAALSGLVIYLISALVLKVDEFTQIRRSKNGK